ncbi:MAG: BTAD domain-containing putative transcriptional regulator [Acidimicrobiales bacterium]
MNRVRRLAAGAGALLVLAVLVAGVPAALALGIGWPLPHTLPSWPQLHADLTSPISDTVLLKALACVVWVGWAILAAALATEAAAAVRGHAARRLPVAGALQPFAGHLVAAVAFAAVSFSLRPATPGPPAPLAAVLLTATHPPVSAGTTTGPPAVQTSSPSANGVSAALTATPPAATGDGRLYVVRRGDTLWGIAAAQLGDPLRWREIYALNNGRPQPDGAALTDPNDIWPGWTLTLPAGTSAPTPAAPPNAATAHPPASPAPVPTPDRPTAPRVSSPHGAPRRPTAATPTAAPQPPARSAPLEARPSARHRSETEPAHAIPAPMVELPSGSAVALGVAAAVGAALGTARLQSRRRHRPGKPRPGLTATEPLAGPTVRRLRGAHLDLLDAQQGGTAGPPADGPGAPEARTSPELCPGRVHAGQEAGAPLVLDLLAQPGVGLVGPGADGAARALAVALVADAGARAELLATGTAASLLRRGTPGVEIAGELTDALGRLEVELVHRSRLLDAHDTEDLTELAASHPEEPLGLLMLLAPAPPPGAEQRLAALLSLGRRLGITAILLGAWPSGLTLTVATDGTVERATGEGAAELGGARLSTLTDAEATEVTGVLAAARGAEEPEPAAGTQPKQDASPAYPIEPPPEQADISRPVELRLLGPLRILASGTEVDTGLRTKARELLAYLATRPQGATDEAIVDALWPDAPAGRGAEQFHTAVGNLRKVLREATGLGEAMFVERTARRYRIDLDMVEVDLWSFQAHLATAAGAADEDGERAAALTAAVGAYGGELVEGARYDWAETLREQLRRQAVDVLTDLAELRETGGDLPGALTLAERAMNVDPYAEAVYRQVMRLQARTGRPDAVVRTYRSLERRLIDLDAEPEPLTRKLLGELTPNKAALPSKRDPVVAPDGAALSDLRS